MTTDERRSVPSMSRGSPAGANRAGAARSLGPMPKMAVSKPATLMRLACTVGAAPRAKMGVYATALVSSTSRGRSVRSASALALLHSSEPGIATRRENIGLGRGSSAPRPLARSRGGRSGISAYTRRFGWASSRSSALSVSSGRPSRSAPVPAAAAACSASEQLACAVSSISVLAAAYTSLDPQSSQHAASEGLLGAVVCAGAASWAALRASAPDGERASSSRSAMGILFI